MSNLLKTVGNNFTKASEFGIEDGMIFLCNYGLPRMSKVEKGGWFVKVDMFVTGKGVKFEIESDYGVETMKGAVHQCIERLFKTLGELNK